MDNTKIYRLPNIKFGALIGLSFIVTSVAFLLGGQNITLNPQLQNIFVLLTIAGSFIGVRKYREEALGGLITYGQALKASLFMISAGAFLYGIYVFILYTSRPDLTAQYLELTELTLQKVYADNPMKDTLVDMASMVVNPTLIAISEIFNKIFPGLFFSLFLAGILRKKAPAQQL